nr:MAG TPA: hypothetical protein [Caudoviricetes sp.]
MSHFYKPKNKDVTKCHKIFGIMVSWNYYMREVILILKF